MRLCKMCRQSKDLEEYYRHPKGAEGRAGKCKECAKKLSRENMIAKRDYYLAYDRMRAKTPGRKKYFQNRQIQDRTKNPLANEARRQVAYAIRKGTLQKTPCYCGEPKVEGHHPDYSRPLEVVWLCHKHHKHMHGRTAF